MALTAKQEAFVKAYLETGNASAAYRSAYNAESMKATAVTKEACLLLQNPHVAPIIAASRTRQADRLDITISRLTEWLIEDRDLARKTNAPAAAVSAVMAIGKLHGLVVDKKEVTRKRDGNDLSIEELYAIASMGRARDTAEDAGTAELDRVHEVYIPRLPAGTASRLDS